MSVATLTDHIAHGGASQEGLVREMLTSLRLAPAPGTEPRDHRLSEPIVVPLPPRAVFDSADW